MLLFLLGSHSFRLNIAASNHFFEDAGASHRVTSWFPGALGDLLIGSSGVSKWSAGTAGWAQLACAGGEGLCRLGGQGEGESRSCRHRQIAGKTPSSQPGT